MGISNSCGASAALINSRSVCTGVRTPVTAATFSGVRFVAIGFFITITNFVAQASQRLSMNLLPRGGNYLAPRHE